MYIVNIFFLTILQSSLAAQKSACKLYHTRFMVAITDFKGEHFCGGSIIHPYWILTAAHCKEDFPLYASDKFDRASYYSEVIEADEIITGVLSFWTRLIRISKIVIHPKYDDKVTYEKNDIALMKLKKRWYKRRVWIVKLPTARRISEEAPKFCPTAATLGWAVENGDFTNGTKTRLKCVELTTIHYAPCAVHYQEVYSGEIPKSSMCTKQANENADYCLPETDTGAPLMCGNVLYGILSNSINCGQKGPIRFTRVDHYLTFIKNVLSPRHSFRSTSDRLYHSKLLSIVFIIFNKIFS